MSMIELGLKIPVTYVFEPAAGSKRGVLVLHGYGDRADSARRRMLGFGPVPGLNVLSPNGIFPSPVRDGDQFKAAYAWYFRDPVTGAEMVAPEFAAYGILELLLKLNLEVREWVILGFSQGGFLAPYLIRKGLASDTIISVGAAYRPEAYEGLRTVRVHAVHGADDKIVDHEKSRNSFEEIKRRGYGVEFHSLQGVGHTLDDRGRALVRDLVSAHDWRLAGAGE